MEATPLKGASMKRSAGKCLMGTVFLAWLVPALGPVAARAAGEAAETARPNFVVILIDDKY